MHSPKRCIPGKLVTFVGEVNQLTFRTHRVFDFIVRKINVSMAFSGNSNVVGVLDIYGFEIFDHNSFEQVRFFASAMLLL